MNIRTHAALMVEFWDAMIEAAEGTPEHRAAICNFWLAVSRQEKLEKLSRNLPEWVADNLVGA